MEDLSFELFVWESMQYKRALLVPLGKGNDLKIFLNDGNLSTNNVLLELQTAQWFPMGIEHTLTPALEDLARRLSVLPKNLTTSVDVRNIWLPSILNVCNMATMVVGQKKPNASNAVMNNTMAAMMKAQKQKLATSYQNLVSQGGYF